MKKIASLFGASALILGSLIGAGILALPISLGLSGLIPSFFVMLVYGGLMYFSAEVLAREAALEQSTSFDFPSLYGKYLGKIGKYLAVITNVIILYGLLVAYISGGGQIIANLLHYSQTPLWLSIVFALMLSFATTLDLSIINKYNAVLVVGLLASFIYLIVLSSTHIQPEHLVVCEWKYSTIAIPLVVTACHFHNIIPTLCTDLKWDLSLLRKSMIIGMILAVMMNLSWVLCGIGCLPRHGENSIIAAYLSNIPATIPMSNLMNSNAFVIITAIFSLVAIVTSFLGNGIGLQNFLNDMMQNTFNVNNERLTRIITFVPPSIIAFLWPNIFIKALDVVGGIGIITLFGILPCIIALKKKDYSTRFKTFAIFFLVCSCLALFSVVGNMFKNKVCKPSPQEMECQHLHEGVTYEIDNPQKKELYNGTSIITPAIREKNK